MPRERSDADDLRVQQMEAEIEAERLLEIVEFHHLDEKELDVLRHMVRGGVGLLIARHNYTQAQIRFMITDVLEVTSETR